MKGKDLDEYRVERIPHKEAAAFVVKWHYSKVMPTARNYSFGLRHPDGHLYAVIVYGDGVNCRQASFLGVSSVIEIKRMCRIEPKQEYPLSRFISITTKMLQKDMRIDAIVAFADPEYGHEGGVYKASGYKFHGKTEAVWHLIDKDGNKRHRRYVYLRAKRSGLTQAQIRDQAGVSRHKTAPKNRWVKYIPGSLDRWFHICIYG